MNSNGHHLLGHYEQQFRLIDILYKHPLKFHHNHSRSFPLLALLAPLLQKTEEQESELDEIEIKMMKWHGMHINLCRVPYLSHEETQNNR